MAIPPRTYLHFLQDSFREIYKELNNKLDQGILVKLLEQYLLESITLIVVPNLYRLISQVYFHVYFKF